ncbi:PREDICTED: protein SMG9-like [Tarenaya hassleriana]|uniref:protein SMG9-like n=1 Tax=Tarenaya hassleriana TaxID=28532 RepID=UPI00053C7A60|nr:PREDICTED: protein SMG9-like [Tarenaya hassleriana]
MAGSSAGGPSHLSAASPTPKILLAKPSVGPIAGKFGRGSAEDEAQHHRSRLPPVSSLNILSDSWDFHIDRFLPFLTENTDFTVVGVIGPPGVGKSTILNEIYGFDASSPGMLQPFAIQSEEIRAMAKHCTIGIEPRISAERFILLDTQPVFSPSILAEMIKPDSSSSIPVLAGESLTAELAHEIMCIQLGILLTSICHILLVVSEGVHEDNMWHLMSTVDLLKHGIPDPSSPALSRLQSSEIGPEKEFRDKLSEGSEYMATPVFVHTKLQDQDLSPKNILQLRKSLSQYFQSHSFTQGSRGTEPTSFVIPSKTSRNQHESYMSAMWRLRDQVLSEKGASFGRAVSEREWLKNSVKIWEMVKSSPAIADYSRMLQSSGLFRR